MISIRKATIDDSSLLMTLGLQTFQESHGHSAPKNDIDSYIAANYTLSSFEAELNDPGNIYHLIYYNEIPTGFSKIILNKTHEKISQKNVTKLERIYILKEHYDKKLGGELFEHNLDISKANGQAGLWLFVWKENERAIRFYLKKGFRIIGSHDFRVSETHSNPNHLMFLENLAQV